MREHDRVIASVRSRIGLILALRLALAFMSGWLLLWGAAVLLLRGAFYVPRENLLWGLIGAGAVLVGGAIAAIRRRPPLEVVRAMLDSHGKCGGLLMTAGVLPIGDWRAAVPRPAAPRVRWRGGRQWGILAACAAFLVASFLMPDRYLAGPGSRRLQVGAEADKLAERIDLLKEEKILLPEKAESLKQALEQLKNDASGGDPAKTWEAMDHLEQSIDKAGTEAAEAAARNAQKSAEAEELAESLHKAGEKMTAKELSEAMKALAEKVEQATKEQGLISKRHPQARLERLARQLKDAAEGKSLTPDQLQDLASEMKESTEDDLEQLQKLADARLIDPSLLSQCRGQCQIDSDDLAKMLAKCNGGKSGNGNGGGNGLTVKTVLGGKGRNHGVGSGGLGGGGDAAAITWTNGAGMKDVRFQERAIPPGAIASLQKSRLQGISTGDAKAEPHADARAGEALTDAVAGSGSAQTQIILPEHKGVVRRYFDRDAKGTSATSDTDY